VTATGGRRGSKVVGAADRQWLKRVALRSTRSCDGSRVNHPNPKSAPNSEIVHKLTEKTQHTGKDRPAALD
jgi:hypothetical protein